MSVDYKGKVYYVKLKKDVISLDLQGKNITDITEIRGLENLNLHELNLNHNKIAEIKGLENHKNLQTLNLSNNSITEIKNLNKLANLQILNLNNNKITEIYGLGNLKKLKILSLNKNPVFDWVKSTFGKEGIKNPQIIVQYCREIEEKYRKQILKDKSKETGNIVFVSYSLKDNKLFKISKVAEMLTSYEKIRDVVYCEEDNLDNFIKYMNEYVGQCDVMLLFCSPNSLNSKFVICTRRG